MNHERPLMWYNWKVFIYSKTWIYFKTCWKKKGLNFFGPSYTNKWSRLMTQTYFNLLCISLYYLWPTSSNNIKKKNTANTFNYIYIIKFLHSHEVNRYTKDKWSKLYQNYVLHSFHWDLCLRYFFIGYFTKPS